MDSYPGILRVKPELYAVLNQTNKVLDRGKWRRASRRVALFVDE